MIKTENVANNFNTTIQLAKHCINKRSGMSDVLKRTNRYINFLFSPMFFKISEINSKYGSSDVLKDDCELKIEVDNFIFQLHNKIPIEICYSISSDMLSKDIITSDSLILFHWGDRFDFKSCIIEVLDDKLPVILEFINSNPNKEETDSFIKSQIKDISLSIEESICDILRHNLSKLSVRLLENPNGLGICGYFNGHITLNMADLSFDSSVTKYELYEILGVVQFVSERDVEMEDIIKYEPNKAILSKYISDFIDLITKRSKEFDFIVSPTVIDKIKKFVFLLNS